MRYRGHVTLNLLVKRQSVILITLTFIILTIYITIITLIELLIKIE
jgi:hypothetical protein